jgi:diaminopimelate epimerase
VEDYTLACGTGSGSLAVYLHKLGYFTETLTVENPGGNLTLTISSTGSSVSELYLEGPTQILGTIEL